MRLKLKMGITGSRFGISEQQKFRFERWYWNVKDATEFLELHHGDCFGADQQFVQIIRKLEPECKIISHPPENSKMRAYELSDVLLDEKPYLDRNHDIVDCSDVLIAFPDGPERLRSGTWATIRYGKKQNKLVIIFYPDGMKEVFADG